jgi:hypothetical protein
MLAAMLRIDVAGRSREARRLLDPELGSKLINFAAARRQL